MLGICNGAQILLEAGLVPGNGRGRADRPQPSRTTAPVPHFVCQHVYLKLAVDAEALRRSRRRFRSDAIVPGVGGARRRTSGRDAASICDEIVAGGHLAFVYAHADGRVDESRDSQRLRARLRGPGQSRRATCWRSCRIPNATRWNFNHPDRRERRRHSRAVRRRRAVSSFVAAVRTRDARTVAITLKIPDNAAYTALTRCGGSASTSRAWSAARFGGSKTSDPEALSSARIERNETIFNPNKHRLHVLEHADGRATAKSWIRRSAARTTTWRRFGGKGLPVAGALLYRRRAPVRDQAMRAAVTIV